MTRRTMIWITMMLVIVLLIAGTFGLLVVAPKVIYKEVRDVSDMRLRTSAIRRLLGYGPLGRAYAVEMVKESFDEWRGYGSSFAIIRGVFPVGCPREEVHAALGPPDVFMSDHDCWWLRRSAKERLFLAEEEPDRTNDWNMHLVVEYDQEGRLERMCVPAWIKDNQERLPAPERSPLPVEAPPPLQPSQPPE